jgi:hypothetical protein
VENVVDGAADVAAKGNELAIHTVQDALEHVALARILTLEELQQLWSGEERQRVRRRETKSQRVVVCTDRSEKAANKPDCRSSCR